jgi:uncharacterized protein (UPF0332 family)
VTVPNPEHFFEQADRLISPSAGAPRQVDLRRAISAAYYGVFHAALTAAADQFVGATKRSNSQYALVYRSIDHKALRDICKEVQKPTLPRKYEPYKPTKGFGPNIRAFAGAALELYEKRLAADYDPLIRIKREDALLAVGTARSALHRFQKAGVSRRKTFLALLLFPPR